MSDTVRIDKWLWAVRIFKSRTMATDNVKAGRVKVRDKAVKPSFLVAPGDTLIVRKNGFDLTFKVNEIISKRVSAVLAAPCYEDLTPESEKDKYKSWYIGKAAAERRDKGLGRPTKRERREIEDYKEESYFEFDFDDDELIE